LEYEKYAEDFIADALLVGFYLASEDVAEGEEALWDVIVWAGEVKCGKAKGIDGVKWCQGV
jgi:hypothetical protein